MKSFTCISAMTGIRPWQGCTANSKESPNTPPALLYIPSKAPLDLFSSDAKHGIHLYCKRVFVMDDCAELMPASDL